MREGRNIGYFVLLGPALVAGDKSKYIYIRWTYDDHPVCGIFPSELLGALEPYRQYTGGKLFPCVFRAKTYKKWYGSRLRGDRWYDIVMKVLQPDMTAKLVNKVLCDIISVDESVWLRALNSLSKHPLITTEDIKKQVMNRLRAAASNNQGNDNTGEQKS